MSRLIMLDRETPEGRCSKAEPAILIHISWRPPEPEPKPVLPLVAEAQERDRLARIRLRLGGASVDPPARRDRATEIAEAEFSAARRRRR